MEEQELRVDHELLNALDSIQSELRKSGMGHTPDIRANLDLPPIDSEHSDEI